MVRRERWVTRSDLAIELGLDFRVLGEPTAALPVFPSAFAVGLFFCAYPKTNDRAILYIGERTTCGRAHGFPNV